MKASFLFFICLVIFLFNGCSEKSETPVEMSRSRADDIGRFQISQGDIYRGPGRVPNLIIKIDTKTGKTWYLGTLFDTYTWVDIGE